MNDKIDFQKTALIFPGQGSQLVGMGKDLFDNFSSAKQVFKTIDEILAFDLKNDLSKIIFFGPAEDLTKTENTQPALMAVSLAIMAVLEQEFGHKITNLAKFVAGHSLGEYSALCAAKAITLEDTARLLQIRGSKMAKCGAQIEGAMAAILGSELELVKEIASEASQNQEICQIANDNSVGQIVISGTKSAVLRAIEIAKQKGVKRAIMLPVSGAFHSQLMADASHFIKKALETITIQPPKLPLIANVSANATQDPEEIKRLLVEQITGSVRWRETMLYMQNQGIEEVIEIGSGKVLSGLVGRTCSKVKSSSIQNSQDIKDFLKRL
jgi:[acyl-carrier-protein] S-malonyltransferase